MRKIAFARIICVLLALVMLGGCGGEKPQEKPRLELCSSMN